MQRTETEIAEIELANNWIDVKNSTISRVKEAFQKHPSWFFTEHDVHSVLYNIAKEELQLNGVVTEKTSDGHLVTLVHHEYPTPFRCSMKGYSFQLKYEKPYRRGHYDLVILNPKFVRNYKLDAVCGKDYHRFRTAMRKATVEPLIWACEVIFFPGVKRLPKNALKIIEPDALKVKETLEYKVGRNVSFCKIGSVLVFTSHSAEQASDLRQIVETLMNHNIEAILTTA